MDTLLSSVADELEQITAPAGGVMRWYNDPVGFARECVNWPVGKALADYQEEIIAAIPTRQRVAVRGPHGLGKTAAVSIAILWFVLTRDAAKRDWKCVTTAGAWRQLERYTWPEVHKWARLLRWDVIGREPFDTTRELLTLNIKLRYGSAFAVASDNPELIEGAHADSVLYIFDESKSITSATFDAAEGAFSGASDGGDIEAFALAVSTPGEPNGRFYDIHRRAPGLSDWWPRHVTKDEAIAAGRISRQWCEQRHQQWGNSAVYHNRVEGEFHSSDEDGVIPLAWVEAANDRWRAWDDAGRPEVDGLRVVGVDVARSGADKTVMALRYGSVISELRHTSKEDTMQTTGRVKGIVEAIPKTQAVVDVIGIGAGVVDRLREQKCSVEGFNASAGTARRDKSREMGFVNCLTGDAQVTPVGNLLRIYRSWYEGSLYEVETASGDHFTATANHQVLTLRGWIPVQSLNVGDQLCNAAWPNAVDVRVGPEDDHVPPPLSEVHGAAYRLFGAERVQGGTVDFHGDRPTGDVDVVTIDRDLLTVNPSIGQESDDVSLLLSLLSKGPLLGQRLLPSRLGVGDRKSGIAAIFPHHGVFGGPFPALTQRETLLSKDVGLGDSAGRNVVVTQHPVDNALADQERIGELMNGLPAAVTADHFGFVDHDGSGHTLRFGGLAQGDTALVEDAACDVRVDAIQPAEGADRDASPVLADQPLRIHRTRPGQSRGGGMPPWYDAVFGEDPMNGGPVGPELLLERLERTASDVPLDEVVLIVPDFCHEGSFVYTLETDVGLYRTSSVVHRNCRSAAWWNVREVLEPNSGEDVALPPNDLLIGDLTAPHWRVMSGGKIQVESKDDIKKRIGRSTDDGDAVVMALWPQSGGWAEVYQVVSCERCKNTYLADLHPERCPKCGQIRELVAA